MLKTKPTQNYFYNVTLKCFLFQKACVVLDETFQIHGMAIFLVFLKSFEIDLQYNCKIIIFLINCLTFPV